MKQVKVLYNPDCSKCQEVKTLLEGESCSFETIDYLNGALTQDMLSGILTQLNLNAIDIVRKKEPLYIKKYEHQAFSNDQWIQILLQNPILIERPIIIDGEKAIIGRPPVLVLDFLNKE